MSRETHVRICEGLGVRFPWATRLLTLITIVNTLVPISFPVENYTISSFVYSLVMSKNDRMAMHIIARCIASFVSLRSRHG